MSSTALAPVSNGSEPDFITPAQVDLLKSTIMRGADDLELKLFLNLCRVKRLDPLTKQIYAIKTRGRDGDVWQYFASIDGLRVIAQRSGEYAGQVGPFWCGSGGEWTDVWLQGEAPAAAKVGVLRKGWTEPMWGVATMKSYGTGKQSPTWRSMTDIMLAKCAESIALRKAFPDDLSGLYVREEFGEDKPERGRSAKERVEALKAYGETDLAQSEPIRVSVEIAGGEMEFAEDSDIIDVDAETGDIAELEPDPGNIEEERKALWLGAQAMGWAWKEFNDKRRELKLPTLEKMTFADVRAMKAGLEA
jgi:phage recombination protein Bet